VLPPFVGGLLPPGIHGAEWHEVRERFGWNPGRRALVGGLHSALRALRDAGCGRVWINGSFVTEKEDPNDFDLCWEPAGVDPNLLDPTLLDVLPPRIAQHVKYGGDVLPNVVEGKSGSLFVDFFQVDSATGDAKGIVELDLRRLPDDQE
jgi:hypothetical protein